MIRIVSKNKICFIGKPDEIFRELEDLSLKYTTLKEAISCFLKN